MSKIICQRRVSFPSQFQSSSNESSAFQSDHFQTSRDVDANDNPGKTTKATGAEITSEELGIGSQKNVRRLQNFQY
jgi:hypothetical protein